MSLFPFLASSDSVISPIEQSGNYFIMDSEQLVSNPFQEMQSDAAGDYTKRSSMTEKHTSVKNNVCENHFSIARSQLEKEKDNRLRNLHENASRLRYEVKLLDLNRRKNEIELRKRIEPRRDFTYDDTQLTKTEKRLGANIESHYLERKLRYPVRAKATADLVITPVIAQARSTLREKKKRPESVRAPTAKSISSSITVASSHMRNSRFRSKWPSRSAPLTASSTSSRAMTNDRQSRLPDIRQHFENSSNNNEKHRVPSQRVKFAFESPHKLIVSQNVSGPMHPSELLFRSHTYHEGMSRKSTVYDSSSDDNDDDANSSERVDLRAILFGKSKDEDIMSVKSHPMSQSVATYNSHNFGEAVRRSQGAPPQHTQEKLRKETKIIQGKINAFLHRLETDPPIKKKVFYESDSEEECTENENNTIPIFLRKKRPPTPKPEEPPPKKEEPQPEDDKESEVESDDEKSIVEEKRSEKDAWKYIRGHDENGKLRGTYTAADLVLQKLTGVLIGHGRRPTVPLHAASRAMRHTATFKMRKVVESLIESRTRYEQHEVDELKKKMDEDMEVPPAISTPTDKPQEVS